MKWQNTLCDFILDYEKLAAVLNLLLALFSYFCSSLFNTPTPGITIQSQELYKLAQYLQEALHREKMLEQKLSTLQELVQNTQESSEGGWQVSSSTFIKPLCSCQSQEFVDLYILVYSEQYALTFLHK